MKDLKYYAQKSINSNGQKEIECGITLQVEGEKFHAYTVSIAHQDLLFYCDKGTLNYLVDSIEDRITGKREVLGIELFNVERD